MAWQTGFDRAVDFGAGWPQYRPDDLEDRELLRRGDVDAVLIVGETEPSPEWLEPWLKELPRVVLHADHGPTSNPMNAVEFTVARTGYETRGRVMRGDGVMLPLRPIWEPWARSEGEWLRAIHARADVLLTEQGR
jgi:formylmethanofuran dehydrogenase subunit B